MINGFILGAAAAVKKLGVNVYIEQAPMGFKRPCLTLRDGGCVICEALGGYTKEEISVIIEYFEKEGLDENGDEGKNFRLGKAAQEIFNAVKVIEVGGKTFRAIDLKEERKSQIVSGMTPSNVEGFGGILTVTARYRRFIKEKERQEEAGVMEKLFEKFAEEGEFG